MKHSKTNRILSVLLTLCMLIGVMPVSAFADTAGTSPDSTAVNEFTAEVYGVFAGNTQKDLKAKVDPKAPYTASVVKIIYYGGSVRPLEENEPMVQGSTYNIEVCFTTKDGYTVAESTNCFVSGTRSSGSRIDDRNISAKGYFANCPESSLVTITYDPNGGTEGPDFQKTHKVSPEDEFTFPEYDENMVKAPIGKTLDYYTVNGSGVYHPGDPYIFFTDSTIKYMWKDKRITITYDPNGGTEGPDFQKTQEVTAGVPSVVEAPTKNVVIPPEGKVFDAVEIEGKRYSEGEKYIFFHDVTIKYLWKDETSAPGAVTVTFDVNGGIKGFYFKETEIFSEGEVWIVAAPSEDFVKAPEGKEFDGYLIENKVYHDRDQYTVTHNVTAQLQWKDKTSEPDTVTVTFDPNGGIKGTIFKETSRYKKDAIWKVAYLSENFVKAPEGKEFDAFEINGVRYEVGNEYTFNTDTTIKFLWKDMLTITYDVNGGVKGSLFKEKIQVNNGYAFTVEAPPEDFVKAPAGKQFDAMEINGQRYEIDQTYTFTKDVTIKLLWKDTAVVPETVTVTYDINGGTKGPKFAETEQFPVNVTIIFHSPSSDVATPPEGKEFDGYLIENKVYRPGDKYTVTHNITAKFIWNDIIVVPENVTVTYDANGGTTGSEFVESKELTKDFEWEVQYFGEDFVKAPEGKKFDALLLNGIRYEVGQIYTFNEDTTMKFLWKDINDPTPPERPKPRPDHSDKDEEDSPELTVHWTKGGKVITRDGEGNTRSYQFKPDNGYHVANVLLDGKSVMNKVKDNCLTIYNANHINELRVIFEPDNIVNPNTGAMILLP